jgi:DNA-binding transcriptional ArsR family regulator
MNDSFKALSDATRRQIIRLLRDRDMTAGEIAEHFAMTKPSISHHLNSLKQAGLVLDERRGQNILYSLNTTVVEEVISWFLDIVGKKDGDEAAANSTGASSTEEETGNGSSEE